MAKILYFEGAGWSDADISRATIGNCRIRTAFHLDDGRRVYLEILGSERTKHVSPQVYNWQYTGFVGHAFYITDDKPNDDENRHSIHTLPRSFEYSLPAILRFVNSLGASFDAVEVLPDYSGYRVFGDSHGVYNYGDEFIYDPALVARRNEKVAEMKKLNAERLGARFDNSSYWVDAAGNLRMRYNCSREQFAKLGQTNREQIIIL